MEMFFIYGGMALLMVVLSVIHSKLRKSFLARLSHSLYVEMDGNAYLNTLNSLQAKLFMRQKTRLFMSVDGYLLNNDLAKAIEVLQKLEKKSLSYAKTLGLYKKEVEVYLDAKRYDEAIAANDIVQMMVVGKTNDAKMLALAQDLNELVEINAKHNGSLAETMVEKAKAASNMIVQSIYYYRAAKCYYFRTNDAKVNKYLQEAKRKSVKGMWQDHIQACLADHTKLLDK